MISITKGVSVPWKCNINRWTLKMHICSTKSIWIHRLFYCSDIIIPFDALHSSTNVRFNFYEMCYQQMVLCTVVGCCRWLLTSLKRKYAIIIINYHQIITTSTAIIPYPNQIEDMKNNYISTSTEKKCFFFSISFLFRMTKTQIIHIIYADKFIHVERTTNTK